MFESKELLSVKILHIFQDSIFNEKAVIKFEEAFPECNTYIEVNEKNHRKFSKNSLIESITGTELLSEKNLKRISQHDLIIFHSLETRKLGTSKLRLLKKIPERIPVIWIGWGYDYYYFISGSEDNNYLPYTKELMRNINKSVRSTVVKFVKNKIYFRLFDCALGINKKSDQKVISALNRVNYFSPVLKEEYEIIKRNYPNFTPKYTDWNYGSSNSQYKLNSQLQISGNNILIGNSATPTNNHLDAFDLARKFEISKRRIICPLSYGNEEYKKIILTKGYAFFGESFYPLTEILPLNDYNKILSSCSVAIMNHLRQQALGNITFMLGLGVKVFLNQANPLFLRMKELGYVIFPTSELFEGEKTNSLERLKDEYREINRKTFIDKIGKKDYLKETKELVMDIICNG